MDAVDESRVPAFKSLARDLRRRIMADDFADGKPLPSDHELANSYNLSRQTVRRAYMELVSEGLVRRSPGKGSFVTPKSERYRRYFSSVEQLLDTVLDAEYEVLTPLTTIFNEDAAKLLGLTTRSMCGFTIRRTLDAQPLAIAQAFMPLATGERLFEDPDLREAGNRSATSLIVKLESEGFRTTGEDQFISAVAADAELAGQLGCSESSPLLRIDRIYYHEDSVPLVVTQTHYAPTLYTHRIRLGGSSSNVST